MFLGQASVVDLKAWRESAADVWSGMFQKRIADGKKLLLWISVLGMGDEEFVHEAMGGVLGADGSFLSEFGVKQSTHLQICTVWWSCLKHNKISGWWVWACLHCRGIGGTSEVTTNTECNSSLAPLQFVPQLLLVGVPYNALVELCLDYDVISKVLVSKHIGPIHFGCDGMALGSPVEVFYQLHTKVLGHLNFSKNLAIEG